MKLHKVKKRTAEPKNIECRMSKDGIASLTLFSKKDRIHYSMFDVGRSMFISLFCAHAAELLRSGVDMSGGY